MQTIYGIIILIIHCLQLTR